MRSIYRGSEVIIRHHEETLWSVGGLRERDAAKIAQVPVTAQLVHVPDSVLYVFELLNFFV